MIITRSRIRSLETHLGYIHPGTTIRLAFPIDELTPEDLERLGFTVPARPGDRILPSPAVGPVSAFNAEGRDIPQEHLPMETVHYPVELTRSEFRGRYDREEVTDIAYRRQKRYPRVHEPAPEVEMTLVNTASGRMLIASDPFTYQREDPRLLHAVNLFLEAFGSVHVLTEGLDDIVHTPVRRISWTMLPEGEYPWEVVQPIVDKIINERPAVNRAVIHDRFEQITRHVPTRVTVGRAGFHGYLAFEFVDLGLTVLESTHTHNATYIFGDNWEELTKLTKREILEGNLHLARVVHKKSWPREIRRILTEGL